MPCREPWGKYRSRDDIAKSPRTEGAAKYLDERGLRILAALDDAAQKHQATPASCARVANRPTWGDRSDRERDEPRATRGAVCRDVARPSVHTRR